jgi:hypothetical protein
VVIIVSFDPCIGYWDNALKWATTASILFLPYLNLPAGVGLARVKLAVSGFIEHITLKR